MTGLNLELNFSTVDKNNTCYIIQIERDEWKPKFCNGNPLGIFFYNHP